MIKKAFFWRRWRRRSVFCKQKLKFFSKAHLRKLGFRNRGTKDGRNLCVVRDTYAKAILIELFFLDNYTDRKRCLELGADKIADAIAHAIGK